MKPTIKISHRKEIVDGKEVTIYTKKCPRCHKTYETTSRSQKFCSPKCSTLYNKAQKKQQEEYSKNKELFRLKSRTHSLAVSVMEICEEMGIKAKRCEICGATEGLELHHKNLNFLDNSITNLQWLCKKHHSLAHSTLEKELAEKGILLEEYYQEGIRPFLQILNKNCRE